MPSNAVETCENFQQASARTVLSGELKGLTIQIPDLKPIFHDWRGIHHQFVNLNCSTMRAIVKERIRELKLDAVKKQRLEAADFGLFTSLWWPEAPLEKLRILSYLVIWLFSWDDEIDEPTGDHSDDFKAAQTYRAETLKYVKFHLGLSNGKSHCRAQSPVVRSIEVVCHALRECYNFEQCQRFFDELVRFVAASEKEQVRRLDEKVPTLNEYWACRLGTSAVYIGTAAGEYSISSALPGDIMNHSAMRAIWNETNVIISITNDLLSLKKEMKHGCVDNIVSLTFANTKDIHAAVDGSVATLLRAKIRFDEAADELIKAVSVDERFVSQVISFVDVQRSNCVGNLIWSLQTHRYGMHKIPGQDGCLRFVL